jgi:hypothetical protein
MSFSEHFAAASVERSELALLLALAAPLLMGKFADEFSTIYMVCMCV